jgi:hypothetical protein
MALILETGICAFAPPVNHPSSMNKQSWRIVFNTDMIQVCFFICSLCICLNQNTSILASPIVISMQGLRMLAFRGDCLLRTLKSKIQEATYMLLLGREDAKLVSTNLVSSNLRPRRRIITFFCSPVLTNKLLIIGESEFS